MIWVASPFHPYSQAVADHIVRVPPSPHLCFQTGADYLVRVSLFSSRLPGRSRSHSLGTPSPHPFFQVGANNLARVSLPSSLLQGRSKLPGQDTLSTHPLSQVVVDHMVRVLLFQSWSRSHSLGTPSPHPSSQTGAAYLVRVPTAVIPSPR